MGVTAVIAAAGSGTRLGVETPKQFLDLMGRPMVAWSLEAFLKAHEVSEIVVVAHPAYLDLCRQTVETLALGGGISVVPGGLTRQESVRRGLDAALSATKWIAVHDAARPFITPSQIDATCLLAREIGAAIAGVPVVDTIKEVDSSVITRTLDRSRLVAAQTPQVCRREDLLRAYQEAEARGVRATDEASLLELIGIPVGINVTSRFNFKVTTMADLEMARALAPVLARKAETMLEEDSHG